MDYALLIHQDEVASRARSADEVAAGMQAHLPYIERLRRNRHYRTSEALGPSALARPLRTTSGKPVATAGPFAESREQIGGLYVVDAGDADEAVSLATACPALEPLRTHVLAIEVRAIEQAWPAADELASKLRWFAAFYGAAGTAASLERWSPVLERPSAERRLAAAAALSPAGSATTVRRRDGGLVRSAGPFAPDRAPLVGYWIVAADGAGEALRIASEGLDEALGVEVRAILER